MPIVIDTLAERLNVVGFGVDDTLTSTADDVQPAPDASDAWSIWKRNRMDRRANRTHIEAFKDGDGYVLVWPNDEGYPIIHPQKAWSMTVIYDEEHLDVIQYAVKAWETPDELYRVNVYYADRVEKYISRRKSHELPTKQLAYDAFQVAGEPWPLPNVWGAVPVFHFANNVSENELGVSELRDVIPIQDALNKSILDMMVAMEFVALPQRWATGIEIEYDERTGLAKEPFKPGVDRVWYTPSEDVKFGEFAQADLAQFLKVSDAFRYEIARISGTPMHYLMPIGTPPSGEALKTLEARFTKKAVDRQVSFGSNWSDVFVLALKMLRNNPFYPAARLVTLWANAEPRSALEDTQVAINKRNVGVSQRQALRELRYTDAQIDEMLVAVAKELAGEPPAILIKVGGRNGKSPAHITGSPSEVQIDAALPGGMTGEEGTPLTQYERSPIETDEYAP